MKPTKAGYGCTSALEGGIKNKSYLDSKKLWTIGVGHLIVGNNDPSLLAVGISSNYRIEELYITNEQAFELFANDCREREKQLNYLIKKKLTPSQFDSVFDFYFNMGIKSFQSGTSGRISLLRVLNDESSTDEDVALSMYDYSTIDGQFSMGRLKRRFVNVSVFAMPDTTSPPNDLAGNALLDGINIIKQYKSMI